MINDDIKRNNKMNELKKITAISEDEFEKLDYKDKQKYFKAKSKLCKIKFVSRDKKGNGITYHKEKKDGTI